MSGGQAQRVALAPIQAEDLDAVSAFLHEHLNPRVSASSWRALLRPPWGRVGPNSGFQLTEDGRIVGVYVAVYSERNRDGASQAVCNLAAFCVLPDHRSHSLRLMRACLSQKGYLFTDLSPSGNVPAINARLGFAQLDTRGRLVLNTPAVRRRARLSRDPALIAATVRADDARIYQDHREAPAARHLIVTLGDRYGYLLYRRDRRKHLPLFASPLHVGGDRALMAEAWPQISSHLLARGLVATIAERRVLDFDARGVGWDLPRPRPKMFRGGALDPADVDYLYSELTLVQW